MRTQKKMTPVTRILLFILLASGVHIGISLGLGGILGIFLSINPNAAWALCRLGWLEVYTDRPDEAEQHFRKALRLSPLDPMNFNNYVGLASAFQVAGDDFKQVAVMMGK